MENKPAYQHDSIIVFIININADHSWFEMTRKILVEGGTNRNVKMFTNFCVHMESFQMYVRNSHIISFG